MTGPATGGEHVDAIPYRIPFRAPFVTSRITHRARHGLILRLRTADGIGLGEASPPPSLGLAAVRDAIASLDRGDTDPVPWLRFGLETARLDLEARTRARPVAVLLCETYRGSVAVNATIGSADAASVADEGARAAAAGFRTVKVKVAVGTLADDERRIAGLRAAVGPGVRIRIDANGGWSEEQAARALDRLGAFDIEYVEQPLPLEDLEAMARLRAGASVRIAADEAVSGPEAARRIVAAGAADVLVVKPARVGGLAAAREIARIARQAGIAAVITSTIDTSIGVAAALHAAASLEDPPPACGLATAALLAGDVVREPLRPRDGAIALSGPGLGMELDDEQLRRWRPD